MQQGFDLATYQLLQLLSGEALEGAGGQDGNAAAFFQPHPPPQAPMLGVDHQWATAADAFPVLPQSLQTPGGGMWAGNGDAFVMGGGDWAVSGGVVPGQGEVWAESVEGSMMLDSNAFLGNDQLVHGGGVPGVQDLLMDSVDLSKFDPALLASVLINQAQAAAHPSMYAPPLVPAAEPNHPASCSPGPGITSQMPAYYPPAMDDYPQPPPASVDIPQATVPDDDEEAAEVAQMVRVAAACGDEASTAWSEEEDQALREGLSRFLDQDNVTKCFNIASGLAKKTAHDVAYRIRWLSDLEQKKGAAKQPQLEQQKPAGVNVTKQKKGPAKQAQPEQEKPVGGNVTKGKGTKGGTRRSNKYPLSKESLNSKSAKDLIRDNERFMNTIEEILKTGQVKNSLDYFYYVKMNMDALRNKVTGLATVMEGLSVHDEEWEDVLKDRSSSA